MFSSTRTCLCSIGNKQPLQYPFRLRHKLKKTEKVDLKLAPDVMKYLETLPYYDNIKESIPKTLLRKYKTPESMYLIHKQTATVIAETLKEHLNTGSPVVEVNPGFGFLTEELLKHRIEPLHLYEVSNNFSPFIMELQKKYPDKFSHKVADFFGMWKLAFQDKIDNGNRIKELLGDLTTDDNDRILKIVGAMPGISFVRHLINTIIFHHSHNQLGRPDLYMAMPGDYFNFLTDQGMQNVKHKSLPAMFQLLFDTKVITKIPKTYYLPWMHPPDKKKASVIDEYCLYLVNIKQKQQLPCSSDHLPLLWYFFRPHMISKSTRIIPMLEQWIPGCGVWLITGQDPAESRAARAPGPHDAPLPHINIFTEFGDLTLPQKLTVFKKFISWPEFDQCPFRVTMENNLPKFISAIDLDEKETIAGTPIDDDMEASDVEQEH
ncbi:hypothetical protein JYU34_018687 [Plutella xylostella]|uniref:rRNA adenine N(6)-methyltransferase n=1 Tax=Plutella xylostella TaxID=51655 RepID=A0ABQ7PYA5_PLUXY|nr:hypothetical protein JYU34_018687 [Plutella xylostella]